MLLSDCHPASLEAGKETSFEGRRSHDAWTMLHLSTWSLLIRRAKLEDLIRISTKYCVSLHILEWCCR